MTNEAIRILKLAIEDSKEHIRFCFDSRGIEALNMAIKALEQQPCEDCISRKELINELKLGYFNNDLQEGKNDPCVIDAMIDWAIRTIKRQPSVTPSYNSVKTELEPCEDWKFYYKHGYAQARNDVLDKIRTEITDWQTDIHDNENDAEIYDFVFERIYEIFDEYKNRK